MKNSSVRSRIKKDLAVWLEKPSEERAQEVIAPFAAFGYNIQEMPLLYRGEKPTNVYTNRLICRPGYADENFVRSAYTCIDERDFLADPEAVLVLLNLS